MKELITAMGSLILMMIFIVQAVGNTGLYVKTVNVCNLVENFREEVAVAGCVCDDLCNELENNLKEQGGCVSEKTYVHGEKEFQSKGKKIEYEVCWCFSDVLVMAGILGINKDENVINMTNDSWVISKAEGNDKE